MTALSRAAKVGMAIESVAGTYLVPVFSVPWTKFDYESMQDPLRDESVRNNDSVLQGLYAGPSHATVDMETNAYPDLIGYFLRFVGPDAVTAATATTLSSSSSIGATSLSTAASIPAGSEIKIDTAANTEYAFTGTPSGAGPYTIPLVTTPGGATPLALSIAHSSAVAVTTATTHMFKQTVASRPASYSITTYDTVGTQSFSGAVMSELGIKIDPKGILTFAPKFVSFPEVTQSTFTPAYTTLQPWLGWQWTMNNAGGASTRGLTYDLTLKRAAEVIHSSDGTQGPREIFNGALEADGAYKVIHENVTDYNLFLNYAQSPTTATLTQPAQVGGTQIGAATLALTMSQSGYQKAKRDLSQTYVQASYDISGIQNATDAGVVQAVLKNFVSTAY